jgi:hypothetical protein
MRKLETGGPEGGNVIQAAVHGGIGSGVAVFDVPKETVTGKTYVIPLMSTWDDKRPPVVFLAGQTSEVVKAGPMLAGLVSVAQLDPEGEEVGRLQCLAIEWSGTPKAGASLAVGYILFAEQ